MEFSTYFYSDIFLANIFLQVLSMYLVELIARVCKDTSNAFTNVSVVEYSMNVKQVGVECHSNMMVARYATQDNRQHILAFYVSHAVQVEFV
jgi:hypothetical protein